MTVLSTVRAVLALALFTREGHDELGHPGLTAALEKSSGSAWERFRR